MMVHNVLENGVLHYSVIDFLTKNGIDYVSLLVIAAVQFHKVFMVINWLHLNPVCFCVNQTPSYQRERVGKFLLTCYQLSNFERSMPSTKDI